MEEPESSTVAQQLRATTKWILAGTVAVASTLVALLPSMFPESPEVGLERLVTMICATAAISIGVAGIVAAAARVLRPRPTTVRDLVQMLDHTATYATTRHLVESLHRSRFELLPQGVESVRDLWDRYRRGTIAHEPFDTSAARVLAYCDDLVTARYFDGLIRRMATFGGLGLLGTAAFTAALATAPTRLSLEWLSDPVPVTTRVPTDQLPVGCSASDALSGFMVAVGDSDPRYLFIVETQAPCGNFGVILDARSYPPIETPAHP